MCRVEIVGGLGVEPPVHVYRRSFLSKIRFTFQSLGKISNISAAEPPVLLGQFQHCTYVPSQTTFDIPIPLIWSLLAYPNREG